MPLQDVIQKHFTPAQKTEILTLMTQMEALLQPNLQNLDPDENVKYGSIKEINKLFANKISDYRTNQPALSSPDVDWVEFTADYSDRQFLEACNLRLDGMSRGCIETKRLHDYDNYQNALIDYEYSKYKDRTEPGLGYDVKVEELKQFFPNTGGGDNNNPPA